MRKVHKPLCAHFRHPTPSLLRGHHLLSPYTWSACWTASPSYTFCSHYELLMTVASLLVLASLVRSTVYAFSFPSSASRSRLHCQAASHCLCFHTASPRRPSVLSQLLTFAWGRKLGLPLFCFSKVGNVSTNAILVFIFNLFLLPCFYIADIISR